MARHREPRRRYYLWQLRYRLQSEWAGLKLLVADVTAEVQDIIETMREKSD